MLASSVSLSVRYHSVKLAAKSCAPGTRQLLRGGTSRAFSSRLLQHSRQAPRLVLLSAASSALSSRNFWWGSSKTSSTPSSPEVAESSVVESGTTTPANDALASASTSSGAVPDITTPPDLGASIPAVDPTLLADPSTTSTLTDTLITHTPVLLQWGDMASAGLLSWTPAGLVRISMEYIHLGLNLPWFWTIVAGTAFWRIVCVPFALKGIRTSAAILPIQPQITAIQARVTAAHANKNTLELQKASRALRDLYASAGVSPLGGLVAMIQLPVTLGVFFGVQKMCTLPLDALKYSGVSFLPDLTVADPTYILPLVMTAAVHLQIRLGIRDINTQERPDMGHMMNVLSLLTIPGFYIMAQFPAGLTLSLTTTALLTSLQSIALRSSSIRRLLKVPEIPPEARGSLPSMASTFRRAKEFIRDPVAGSIRDKIETARKEEMAKRRRDALRARGKRF